MAHGTLVPRVDDVHPTSPKLQETSARPPAVQGTSSEPKSTLEGFKLQSQDSVL